MSATDVRPIDALLEPFEGVRRVTRKSVERLNEDDLLKVTLFYS